MSKIKFGLKIWSADKKDLFKKAVQLFKKGKIDFIELYIVPGSFALGKSDVLNDLRKVPITIHSPHNEHNFDVFTLDDSKIELFKNQVIKTADFLGSKYIVVHAGVGDSCETFKEKIERIKDKRIIIENMTKVGTNNELCFGYSSEQLKFIRGLGFDFCFDFSHAIKSAISQKLDYKEFVKELISELDPVYFHICNGKINVVKDEHRDLFDGEFDLKWIKEILLGLGKDVYLVFETPKGEDGLKNDVKNMKYFRSI